MPLSAGQTEFATRLHFDNDPFDNPDWLEAALSSGLELKPNLGCCHWDLLSHSAKRRVAVKLLLRNVADRGHAILAPCRVFLEAATLDVVSSRIVVEVGNHGSRAHYADHIERVGVNASHHRSGNFPDAAGDHIEPALGIELWKPDEDTVANYCECWRDYWRDYPRCRSPC